MIALTGWLGVALATSGAYAQKAKGTAMQGFVGDIEELSEESSDFRRILYTGSKLQAGCEQVRKRH
jgi:hypothetical protein